jgi:hypothetical protein
VDCRHQSVLGSIPSGETRELRLTYFLYFGSIPNPLSKHLINAHLQNFAGYPKKKIVTCWCTRKCWRLFLACAVNGSAIFGLVAKIFLNRVFLQRTSPVLSCALLQDFLFGAPRIKSREGMPRREREGNQPGDFLEERRRLQVHRYRRPVVAPRMRVAILC